jgi:hypothetical protein
MPKPAKLTLVLANGTSEILHQLQDVALRAWLARAAGRGTLRRTRADVPEAQDHLDFEWHLLGALGLQAHTKELASAPVCLAAESVDGFWMHAEPVHFAAGMTRIDAVTLKGATVLNEEDRLELGLAIGEYVRDSGLQWNERRWLIGFSRELAVQTRQPNLISELENAMPTGADAKELRRLMTELQMLLHEHPVNNRRARLGLPAANAVWLWGGGLAKSVAPNYATPMRIFGADSFTSGLAVASGTKATPLQNSEQVLNEMADTDSVAVLELKAQNLLTDWLQPLQAALSKGRLRSLVIALDQWTIELTSWSSWRVWRSALTIERWRAA